MKLNIPSDGAKIRFEGTKLIVPENPIIPYIIGDGIGIDVTPVMKRVLDHAINKAYGNTRQIKWLELYAGSNSNDLYGSILPQETIDAMREYRISIKGPLTTPIGSGHKSINVMIRQKLDLFACVRPIKYFPGTSTPMAESGLTDMVVFRENTEDLYSGIEWEPNSDGAKRIIEFISKELGESPFRFRENCGIGIKPVSEEGTKRLVRMAIDYALELNKSSITIVHKGNIMKFTEGAFRDWSYDVVTTEYSGDMQQDGTYIIKNTKFNSELLIKDCIADNFLQQIILAPEQHDVIATLNLNGDYISDALAAQVGGIGMAPGGNIGEGCAVFEATHGSAEPFAGKNRVNPGSIILSGEMMLRYMGWTEAADLIIEGLAKTISQKTVTYDFERLMTGASLLKCSEFGDAIIKNMD